MLNKELEKFLEEDLPFGDITTDNLVKKSNATGVVICNEEAVLSGLKEAIEIFNYFDIKTNVFSEEGEIIEEGNKILEVRGDSRDILKSERLALNFLTKMSGISTKTRKAVNECRKRDSEVKVAGTRKTTPGFRKYEKRAIEVGGGEKHRMSLSDAVLIKDNHIELMGLEGLLKNLNKIDFTKKVEVEVENKKQAKKVAKSEIDILMLDNFKPKGVEETIEELKERDLRVDLKIEVSGGISIDDLSKYAGIDIDIISMGSLTHTVEGIDFSFKIIE